MRNAPSVVYPVGRCALYGVALLTLGTGVLVSLLLWGWTASVFGSFSFWWVVVLALSWGGWAAREWLGSGVGELHWDSLATPSDGSLRPGAWIWHPGDTAHSIRLLRVVLALDWQRGVLLRLTEPSGREHWAWAERIQDPDRWGDLRRALTAAGSR